MDRLPTTIKQHMYEYGRTYKVKFGKVLKQMTAHCLIVTNASNHGVIVIAIVKCVQLVLNTAIKCFTMK